MAGLRRKSTRAKAQEETPEITTETDENVTTVIEDHTDATPEASEETKKRTRAPIETGNVVIQPSEDQESSGRNTRLDTDPVPVAVRDAQEGLWYDVKLEVLDDDAQVLSDEELAKRREGIKALLRRAGQHYGKGINIDPRDYPDKVRFKTGPRRQVKSRKSTVQETPPEVNMAAADDGYDYSAELQTAQANQDWGYDSNAA